MICNLGKIFCNVSQYFIISDTVSEYLATSWAEQDHQSPDFYANLQTGFVGRFEENVGRIDKIGIMCSLF